jgi:hypothetical protein
MVGGTPSEDNAGKTTGWINKAYSDKSNSYATDSEAGAKNDKYLKKDQTFEEMFRGFGQEMTVILAPVMDDLMELGQIVLPKLLDSAKFLAAFFDKVVPESMQPYAVGLGLLTVPILGAVASLATFVAGLKLAGRALGISGGGGVNVGDRNNDRDSRNNRNDRNNGRPRRRGRLGIITDLVPNLFNSRRGGGNVDPAPGSRMERNANRGGGILSKSVKLASKAVVPVTVALGVMDIVKSDNKSDAVARTTGAGLGGWGGAAAGAAIGTMIFPGVGTAIGGLVGGVVGAGFGDWIGGQVNQIGEKMGGLSGIKDKWNENWSILKDGTGVVVDAIKTGIDTKMTNIKDGMNLKLAETAVNVGERWISIQDKFGAGTEFVKTTVNEGFETIKNSMTSKIEGARNRSSEILDSLGAKFGAKTGSIQEMARTGFDRIRELMTNPVEKAKTAILGIVENIKSVFSNLKLPEIKMPSLSSIPFVGKFFTKDDEKDKGKGEKEKGIRISQRAKGGIFGKDAIVNLAENGMNEAVLPLNGQAMMPFANAVSSNLNMMSSKNGSGNGMQSLQVESTSYIENILQLDGEVVARKITPFVSRMQEKNASRATRMYT